MHKNVITAAFVVAAAVSAMPVHATNFFEGFDGTGGAGSAWETANWANGDIFGCTFAYSEVWRTGQGTLQLNVNSSNSSNMRCAEIRTWQSFTYGKFVTRMQPGTIQGGDSSFFLYTGNAGTSNHFEIDIEFINAGRTLHTNVWTAGKQNYQQFAVATGWRTIGFEWRPTFVRWFNVDDAGVEHEFRRVNTSITAPMRLMLNHWVGNNSAGAKNFVGTYTGGGGGALYDWVKVSD
ncbi:family 16 glycosylhydrolase [Uliginosibacterium gangwonense]|uniref:family 16 glycosylhydrolase n=1 Tax=Uliginosibacterium gangwonense TaxID=392736 RepID=UPI00036E1951|nr:family 16 glycosylhydrolase [Uliginosibacterium gangwonense]